MDCRSSRRYNGSQNHKFVDYPDMQMHLAQLNGAVLSKMVWALSPFYTALLVYLLPFVMTAGGRRFRNAVISSWIFVTLIMSFEGYLLPFLMMQLDGNSGNTRIPDPMPGLGVIVLFGWIPGCLLAGLGRFTRWCYQKWRRKSHPIP